jgi:hypothetical protein
MLATSEEATMQLQVNVFDTWVFRRTGPAIEYLLLHTSQLKAERYFNGGRFWQIPSGAIQPGQRVVDAVLGLLQSFGLTTHGIWAAEHVYTIYNRRFESMQMIAVYAAEVVPGPVQLDPEEHAEARWCSFEESLARVNYRGLKDGLRSTLEYVTGVERPLPELQLL